ncbi:Txe/YoeB family addiction module toxin [Levilactobacillus acidifarinae]|uniref:Txe/YoeB family addiction module toxin n=1 Tax=Levilactobacillus acidifarinae TaxID=267364 RepID=UPI000710C48E|nr:Txe/YoeB family addiction module toxin [Levilactobacillus acidifarinae]GEO69711.1 hypothetical protein LAC03_16210 [Levilactobacillus acidifarinae]
MIKQFSDNAWNDYMWMLANDQRSFKRINKLIKVISRTPFEGIGKPEALHGNLSGFWSRRINEKDRLVYAVNATTISIAACRGHYG